MSEMEFEVRESDLLGRIGTLTVNGRKVETPCLMPVVHPVNQSVSVAEVRSAGFEALMTNSFIMYSRLKDKALEKGVHSLLGFDGLVMTDSGGYQVLRYGSVEADHRQIALFQSEIGSDLAVTLDRPTGYSRSRRYAEETMKYSLERAVETIGEFHGSKTTWVGPVQGGLFPDLLRRSATGLLKAGFSFLALGSPTEVMENYRYAELVRMIAATRGAMPYSVPLHLFGAGHTLTMALAVALGCDTFDSASYILFAREGRYMTEMGVHTLQQMKHLPCSCPACNSTSAEELKKMDPAERTRKLALHNLHALRREVQACKEAISEGRLWDVVEQRSYAHPSLREAFVEMSKQSSLLEAGTPHIKEKGLLLRGAEDLLRPELSIASRRLGWAMRRRRSRALLVIPGTGEPLTGRRLAQREYRGWDVYRVHAVLGPYPVELDFVYPFTQTVGKGRIRMKEWVGRLRRMGYKSVKVLHEPPAGEEVRYRLRRRGASPSPP